MEIVINKGIGKGKTKKSAFDDALRACGGLHNNNIIPLSSVIPPGSKVVRGKELNLNHGDRLYVVIAETAKYKGKVASGLCWEQESDGRGLLLEYSGETEEEVFDVLKTGMDEMKQRRGFTGKSEYEIVSGESEDGYVCSMVVAVYKEEKW